MCGIAAIISKQPGLAAIGSLQKMADALRHRGPDGEGFWQNEQQTIGFAHRRLSIIDLSDAASQPMAYQQYQLIFNGEIYNYQELRKLLSAKGYVFKTTCDAEVIPAAFDYWGPQCLHQFDGMFAFALFNPYTQQIFAARDRFGEKPLYYTWGPGKETLFLASEMKAFWAIGLPKIPMGTPLLNYLTLGKCQDPNQPAQTFYRDIFSLPAGHLCYINTNTLEIKTEKWYKPERPSIKNLTPPEASGQLQSLFLNAVQNRLHSDVAVGTSLSGGLDSSSILAAIHQLKSNNGLPPQWSNLCFTAIFPGFEKDESVYAARVSDYFSVKQFTVAPTAGMVDIFWEKFCYSQEEPVQSSSAITQYLVYQLAKNEGVKVLLDGQGADETLAGYTKYTSWFLQQLWPVQISKFRREKELFSKNGFLGEWGKKNLLAAIFPKKVARALQQKALRQQQENRLINPEFLHAWQNEESLQKPETERLNDLLWYNCFDEGLQELLRYADRNSMAHGVEVRLPFLQHELVQFLFSLSENLKMNDGFTKWILRIAMQQWLPSDITWRPGKIGYEPPQKSWMAEPAMAERVMESRRKLVAQNVFRKQVLDMPLVSAPAHAAENFDWRSLSAASMFI